MRGHVSARQWRSAYSESNEFERVLTDDGTVIVKFWLHISEKEQRRRFKTMEQSKYHRRRITRSGWKAHKQYRDYVEAGQRRARLGPCRHRSSSWAVA